MFCNISGAVSDKFKEPLMYLSRSTYNDFSSQFNYLGFKEKTFKKNIGETITGFEYPVRSKMLKVENLS